MAYAGLAALVVAPLFAWALPRQKRSPDRRAALASTVKTATVAHSSDPVRLPGERILALTFTSAAILMTAVSVQLLLLLQASGIAAGTAVALSTLIGPSQVGARVVELVFGRRSHPIWALLASSGSVGLGLVLLAVAPTFAWLAIILYGAGNGMRTVVRGTLPLALYGQHEYAAVMGRLARLPLLGQAMTPLACGYVSEWFGLDTLLLALLAIALLNVGLSLLVVRQAALRGNAG